LRRKNCQPSEAHSTYTVCGSGKTFLYIPGIEGTGRVLYRHIDDLSRDHQVISLRLRGEGNYKLDALVDDVVAVAREVPARQITVLAESFGGLVALAAALGSPGLFERMILLNTFPWFEQRAKIRMGVALFSLMPYSLLKAYRTKRSRDELFSDDISLEHRTRFHELTRVVPREGYLSRLKIIRDTDLRPHLKNVAVPTLVVVGSHDGLFNSVKYGTLMSSRIPRARLKILDGTGHAALLAEGVRVRDWLREFEEF
jgi:pimeloyl-ACP methyl ester carboxylesterase